MDDMRQKLFPIFLKEAERNLGGLRSFLDQDSLVGCSAEELESAFRSAHTLKGTSNLVQAESVCKISRRLEALLEKHFIAGTLPTPVEHEAMKLAVDWLATLVSALKGDVQEPRMFVDEALQALDLAEAFPGKTPLVELLDSQAEKRSPRLDDPFDSDPGLDIEESVFLTVEQDPFAEDPGFGMGLDLANNQPKDIETPAVTVADPFAEDESFADDPETAVTGELSDTTEMPEDLPYDPFAEDDLGQDLDPLVVADNHQQYPSPEPETFITRPKVSDVDAVEQHPDPAAEIKDPFAEDDDFIDSYMATEGRLPENSTELVEPALAQTGGITDDLLLPQQEVEPRKEYSCCAFSISGRDYHLPISQMLEIADLPSLVPLPLAPDMVSGLVNLRGQVIPVINLAVLNRHVQSEVRLQQRLVVAGHQGELLAFLADGVPYLSDVFIGQRVDVAEFLAQYRINEVEE